MDVLNPEQRRRCMQSIKGRNTRPEVAVRSICHRLGYRFRISKKNLPGTPDLVFARLNICMFVHGCFWHRHEGCKYAYTPKTRTDFWTEKFLKNRGRDIRVESELSSYGWTVVIVWECELRDKESLVNRLQKLLGGSDCNCRD
ncbi:very short patch repair endonuclease [Pseudomonas cichorii]|uniref:very short patch repair endonuclease n=1 Tax=Pseudomonas cichorii TaxID=36746 RepID=UPI001C8A2BA3|nr:very short patch repair endonuclease [Pseudomonas cichorii]MBX8516491.1 very short patch repair endonuclease [Pseudomonas cichorii]